MLALSSIANAPTSLTLPPSVLAVTTPDLVSTRVTSVALPAPLSDLQVTNDAGGGAAATETATAESAAQNASSGDGISGALTGNLTASGPSAPYLAQAYAQADSTLAFALSYAQFLPAPQYDTLVGYSFVKYKPSDAGIPTQQTSEYDAYNTTQSRNQSNLSPANVQMIVAG